MFYKSIIIVFLTLSTTIYAVDMDYYTGASLRNSNLESKCKNSFYQLHCQFNCGTQTGLCIDTACFCLQPLTRTKKKNQNLMPVKISLRKETDNNFNDFFELNQDYQENEELEPLNTVLALRHHIAHFCPNLDVARECIKKCMPLGKPAFCGKDHVCYCGHKYTNNDKDPEDKKVSEIYSEFKDMYKKYFGGDKHEENV